jgi:hypothetical protein
VLPVVIVNGQKTQLVRRPIIGWALVNENKVEPVVIGEDEDQVALGWFLDRTNSYTLAIRKKDAEVRPDEIDRAVEFIQNVQKRISKESA